MYDYILLHKNKKAKALSLGFFIASLILFALGGYRGFAYRWILQALSFSFLAAAILVFGRFLARVYAYRVDKGDDGEYEFCVDEVSREGRVCVCRLLLADLLAVEPFDKKGIDKGQKLYTYTVDIDPGETLLLTFRDRGDEEHPILLRVSPDEKGKEILSSFERANKGE